MRTYTFEFTGVNRDTNETKIFTIVAASEIAAFDRIKSENKGWDFTY